MTKKGEKRYTQMEFIERCHITLIMFLLYYVNIDWENFTSCICLYSWDFLKYFLGIEVAKSI